MQRRLRAQDKWLYHGLDDDKKTRTALAGSKQYVLDPAFVIVAPNRDPSSDHQWELLYVTLGCWGVLGIVMFLMRR
jgi:hypothetical protein